VYSEDDELQGLTPAEIYRRRKVDHYLQIVQDHVDMGRYLTALKTLDMVLSLDRANQDAKDIRKAVDEILSRMLHRGKNGHSNNEAFHPPAPPRRNELVMVVDQDERLLKSLTESLRKYGFMSVGASSFEEAVDTFAMVRPDVAISEVNFETGPRGFDLYSWLKTNSGKDNLPFLFLATRIDRETLIAGKRFGVDDLITKPVDDDVVIASVINALSRRKAALVQV
jgi:PleD family two-component response regulator